MVAAPLRRAERAWPPARRPPPDEPMKLTKPRSSPIAPLAPTTRLCSVAPALGSRTSIMGDQYFYVITGASGAGKSTLIAALGDLGYATIPEAALAVLREQRKSNSKALPSVDRAAFMRAVLARSIGDYETALSLAKPVFFDRGIPEWLRFLDSFGDEHRQLAARCRYASTIFLAEPWPEIYVRDHERQASFDRAARSYEATVSAYSKAGYDTCVIPKVSIQERVAFILAQTGLVPGDSFTPMPSRDTA